MANTKEINLKNINFQIFLSVFISLISISVYFIASSYFEAIANEERNVLKRLHAITSTTALQINADEHEIMFSTHPEKDGIKNIDDDSNYYKIHEILVNVSEINKLHSPIYTAVYDFDTKEFLMGVSSDKEKVFFRHEYTSYPPEVIEHYHDGAEIPTYKDEYGSWLSSFTPLIDSKGNVIAIIQTDVTFDDFISETRGKLFRNIIISICVLLIVGLIMLFSLRSILKKDKQAKTELVRSKILIQEKQQELVESITYALRIQKAILPSDRIINDALANNFVLYLPKDIVAGDFYWLEQKSDVVLYAAADCTGHGVPGAMVSVVCHNALNRAAREFNISDPGKLLDKARELVIATFDESDENVKDGMDISLCAIDYKAKTLKWAGANNPLWIIRNEELIETKPDKQPIGNFDNQTPFTTHEFQLQDNDLIYVFSDGFVDQFGGPKGKKFKPAALRKLLLSIHEDDLAIQKEKLLNAFIDWKGDFEQLDDLCLIGVRI